MSAKPEELKGFLFFDNFKFVMIGSNKNAAALNGSGNSYRVSERKSVICPFEPRRFVIHPLRNGINYCKRSALNIFHHVYRFCKPNITDKPVVNFKQVDNAHAKSRFTLCRLLKKAVNIFSAVFSLKHGDQRTSVKNIACHFYTLNRRSFSFSRSISSCCISTKRSRVSFAPFVFAKPKRGLTHLSWGDLRTGVGVKVSTARPAGISRGTSIISRWLAGISTVCVTLIRRV